MNSTITMSVLIFLVSLIISGCCNCGKTDMEKNSLQGIITIVGHEPEAKLALRVDDNTVYLLKCSKELRDELWKEQGNLYYIKYSELIDDRDVKSAVIEKVIPLKKFEKK